jgi:hypothetical protein
MAVLGLVLAIIAPFAGSDCTPGSRTRIFILLALLPIDLRYGGRQLFFYRPQTDLR